MGCTLVSRTLVSRHSSLVLGHSSVPLVATAVDCLILGENHLNVFPLVSPSFGSATHELTKRQSWYWHILAT